MSGASNEKKVKKYIMITKKNLKAFKSQSHLLVAFIFDKEIYPFLALHQFLASSWMRRTMKRTKESSEIGERSLCEAYREIWKRALMIKRGTRGRRNNDVSSEKQQPLLQRCEIIQLPSTRALNFDVCVRNKKLGVDEEKGESIFFKCLLKCQLLSYKLWRVFRLIFLNILPSTSPSPTLLCVCLSDSIRWHKHRNREDKTENH